MDTENYEFPSNKQKNKRSNLMLMCAGDHPPITLCEQVSSDVTRFEMQAIHDMMLNEMLGYI